MDVIVVNFVVSDVFLELLMVFVILMSEIELMINVWVVFFLDMLCDIVE